jgi:hypothetical protein
MDETLAPPRNFFISTADRVRAAHGPPAYSRRKRHIEDLEASLVAMARDAMRKFATEATEAADATERAALAAADALAVHAPFVKALREMNRLIAAHNLYYPIEANLRLDPVTRQELDRGRPYKPLPAVTQGDIMALAIALIAGIG